MPYCPICEKCLYLNGRKGSENRKYQLGSNLRKHKALRASGVSGGGGGGCGGGARGSRVGPGASTAGSNEVVSTKCGHLYHQSCLNEYITNYRTKGDIYGTTYNVLCPLCGANLSNGKMLKIDLEAHFGILEEFFTDLCKLKYMNKELKRTLELEWVDISELEKKISETKSEYEHVKGIKRNNEQKCKATEDRIAKAIEDASTCYRYREIEKQLIDENINLEAVARRMETIISSRICTTFSTSKKEPRTSSETETVEENASNRNIHFSLNMNVNDTNNNNNNCSSNNDILCHTNTIKNSNNYSDNNNNNNNAAGDYEADHDHKSNNNNNNNNNNESCDHLPVASPTFPLHQHQPQNHLEPQHQHQHQIELKDEERDHKNNNHSLSLLLKQPHSLSPQDYDKFVNAAVERRSKYNNNQLSSGESFESIRESNRKDQGHDHDSDANFYPQNKGSTSTPKMGQGQSHPHLQARGQVDISVQISVHSAWSLNSVGGVESETVLLKRYAQEQRLTLCSRTGSNLSINSSHLNVLENLGNQQQLVSLREQEPSDLQITDKDNNKNNSLIEKYSSGADSNVDIDIGVQKILSSIQLSKNHNQICHFYNKDNPDESCREIISSDYNIKNTDDKHFRNKPNLLEYPCESEWRIEEKDSVTSEFSQNNNNNNTTNDKSSALAEIESSTHNMITTDPRVKRLQAIGGNVMVNVDKSRSYTVRTYQHSSLIHGHEKLPLPIEKLEIKDQKLRYQIQDERKNQNNNEIHHEEREEDKSLIIPVDKSKSYTIQTFDHSSTIYNGEDGNEGNFWPPQDITSTESIDPLLRSLLYPTSTYNQNRRIRNCEKRLTRNHNDLPGISNTDTDKPIISNIYPQPYHHHHNIMDKYQEDTNSHPPNRKLAATAVVENSVILGKYSMCFVPSQEDIVEEGEKEHSVIITEGNPIHNQQKNFSSEMTRGANNRNNDNHTEQNKYNNNKPRSKHITRKLKTLSLRRHEEETNDKNTKREETSVNNNNKNKYSGRTLKQLVITPPHMFSSGKTLQLSPSKNKDDDSPSSMDLSLSFPPLPAIPTSEMCTVNEVKPDENSIKENHQLASPSSSPNSGRKEEKQREILPAFDNHLFAEFEAMIVPPPPMSPTPRHPHCHHPTRDSMMGFTKEERAVEEENETGKTSSSSSFPCETPESTRRLLESLLLKSPPSSPHPQISNNNNNNNYNNNTSCSVIQPESGLMKKNICSVNNSHSTSIIAPPGFFIESDDDEDELLHSLIESSNNNNNTQNNDNNDNNNNNNYRHETCSSKNEKDVENPFMKNSGGGDVFEEFGDQNQNQNVMSINNLSINHTRNHNNNIIPHHHITPEENQIKYVITTTTTTSSHHHHHHQATSTQTLKSTPSKPDYICLAAERFVQDTCLQSSSNNFASSQSVNVGVEPADDLRNSNSNSEQQQNQHQLHHPHLQRQNNNMNHPYNVGVVSTGIGITKNDQGHHHQHQREQQQQQLNRQQYNHNHNRHHYMSVICPSEHPYYNTNDHGYGYSLSNAPSRYWSFENSNTNPTVTTPIVIDEHEKISNHFINNSATMEGTKMAEIEDGCNNNHRSSSSNHQHPQGGEDINNINNNNSIRSAYFSPTALLHGRRKSSHVSISNPFNSPYESRVSLPFLEQDHHHLNNQHACISSHDININSIPSRTHDPNHNYYYNHSQYFQNNNNNNNNIETRRNLS